MMFHLKNLPAMRFSRNNMMIICQLFWNFTQRYSPSEKLVHCFWAAAEKKNTTKNQHSPLLYQGVGIIVRGGYLKRMAQIRLNPVWLDPSTSM